MFAYIARQPIFDASGNVFAYKLKYRTEENGSLEKCGSEETNKLFDFDIHSIVGKSRAFVDFTDEMLIARLAESFSVDILTVEISKNQLEDKEIMSICRALKERSYMIALNDFECGDVDSDLLQYVDLVEIDFRKSQGHIEETAYFCRSCDKLMLAVNIENRDQHEYAKRLGCTFMQGLYFAKPSDPESGEIQPLPASIMETMRIMSESDPEIDELVEVISRDSVVCQKLLRLINSVYFGFTTKISSINQAIVVLGLDYLREWVYLMAVQRITQNDSAEALRMSLLMAKFCRKLALHIPAASKAPDSFYLMGLLSMVVFSGDRFLAQALEEFPLTSDIKKGLLRRGGIYSDIFEMALNYLLGNWDNYEEIAANYELDMKTISSCYVSCTEEVEQTHLC